MRLSDDRYEEIKNEVTELFIRYEVNCIPISGFELAIKMGIRLMPYSSLSQTKLHMAYLASDAGFYFEPGDGTERIYYNDLTMGYERMNWTILHEIGHAALGHPADMNHDESEAEANFFAKYAIAPPPLVQCIHPTCAEDIMDAFCLSHEASMYAYDYYNKWLQFGRRLTSYERRLLWQFSKAS